MACLHSFVGGFDDGSPGMMHIRIHVGQLDKILEILQPGFSATPFLVKDKGRSVHGSEDHVVSPNLNVIVRISRQLGESAGCFRDVFFH